MGSMKIFIDEQAWLALVIQNHPFHSLFKAKFQHLLEGGYRFYTTNVIIGNVVSELKKKLGPDKSIEFYNIIEEAWLGNHLLILWLGRRTMKDAFKLFKRFPESRLSVFDCANIMLMNRRNIRFILTSNVAYSEMGFKVVPDNIGE